MRQCLLILTAIVAIVTGAPASAQYMWIDTNGDGINGCTTGSDPSDDEHLDASVTSIDIWLSTDKDIGGNPVVCPSGETLTINSYTFVLTSGYGTVTYGAWTDNMNFAIAAGGPSVNATDYFIGRASATITPPGTYKLGSLAVTVIGTPFLFILPHSNVDNASQTSFGSQCSGQDLNNTMRYADNVDQIAPGDWNEACGVLVSLAVSETTWGKIKKMYK
jgi:hypothetical protein